MPPGRKSNASIAAQNAVQPPYPVLEQPIQPDSAEIAHLTILAADVIDALPPSVTRSLSDLKELDAVLNASILSIHEKLDKLHAMMMAPPEAYTPQQRLELLKEVAEDANAFKLGGEDKIRVATGACETVRVLPSTNHVPCSCLIVDRTAHLSAGSHHLSVDLAHAPSPARKPPCIVHSSRLSSPVPTLHDDLARLSTQTRFLPSSARAFQNRKRQLCKRSSSSADLSTRITQFARSAPRNSVA